MAELGHIKTVRTLSDDSFDIDIETGSGPVVTAKLLGMSGARFHPMDGDPVSFSRAGQEIHIHSMSGGERSTSPGEVMLFSRNVAGATAVTLHLTTDGKIKAGNGLSAVSLAQKVDAIWNALVAACNAFTPPGTPDGGAALSAAIAGAISGAGGTPVDTGSTILESD